MTTPLVPHPPLLAYYDGSAARVPFVRRIFDDTAPWYDSISQVMSFRTGERYRHDALARNGLQTGMKLLDLASGTGVVARNATAIVPVKDITCLDPSIGMMLAGRAKQKLRLSQGVAEQLPFSPERFDFVVIGYALRHFADLRIVFEECRRVLRPNGKLLILEITKPRSPLGTRLLELYMMRIVPTLAAAIGNRETKKLMQYYWDTIKSCVPPESILDALRDSGFSSVQRHAELSIFSEYSGARA